MVVRLLVRNTIRTDSRDRGSRLTTPAWMVASTSSITAREMAVGTDSTTRGSMMKVATSVRTIHTHSIVVFSLGEVIIRHAQSHSRTWCQTSSVVNDAITTTEDHPPRTLAHEACLPLVLTLLQTGLARVRHTTRERGTVRHPHRRSPATTFSEATAGEDLIVVSDM